jgi:polysaccharide pyruvyl transferase WcaK-like protein
MRRLRVLQVASWCGNIGDNANHAGAYSRLKKNLNFNLAIEPFEIREVYWGSRSFDSDFVSLCNEHDLVVIGGGNYFELWVEKSSTGCSIDLPERLLDQIRPPILFYSLGCDRFQGVPDICLHRFGEFIRGLLDRNNCFVSVRNDGSLGTIKKLYGTDTSDRVTVVPDGGFFFRPPAHNHPELKDCSTSIAINLAGDMLSGRFPGGAAHDPDSFLREFGSAIVDVASSLPNGCVILVPHIPKDVDIISRLMAAMPDRIVRKSVRVAPLLSGNKGAAKIFDLYRQADVVLGMRFHANVCPLGMGRKTIGLGCYGQIFELYSELGLEDWCLDIRSPGFGAALSGRISKAAGSLPEHRAAPFDVVARLERSIDQAHGHIDRWLSRYSFRA